MLWLLATATSLAGRASVWSTRTAARQGEGEGSEAAATGVATARRPTAAATAEATAARPRAAGARTLGCHANLR